MGGLSFARRPSPLGVCFGCGILYQTIASYHLQKDKTLSSAVIICIYPASVNFVISNRSTKDVMSNRSYKERNPSTHTPGIRTTTNNIATPNITTSCSQIPVITTTFSQYN